MVFLGLDSSRRHPVYLIDVEAYKPPDEYKVTMAACREMWVADKVSDADQDGFLRRIHERSGIADHGTFLPPSINPKFCGSKAQQGLDHAKSECEMAIFAAVEGLLAKTGLRPDQIDILVTTCSIYCPTPSMASMVVNRFKMRSNVQSYHLGGMGCSNGAVGINLIHDLLQAHPGSNALFITTETTTPAFYPGKDRARLITNILFRMGASAVLLSNKASWGGRIKYKLLHHQRVQLAANDDAFTAIHYSPDAVGINGLFLGKNVVSEATRALTIAMRCIAPRLLTWRQLAQYGASVLQRKVAQATGGASVSAFSPAFEECAQHFLIHAGGAKVLEGIGRALKLSESSMAASAAVMHDYGNVSSSSTWYTLAFVETVQGVSAGDKVLQIGVGSGIKCGVNVWQAQKHIRAMHAAWEHRLSPQEAEYARHLEASDSGNTWTHLLSWPLLVACAMLLMLWLHFGSAIVSTGVTSLWPGRHEL